MDKETIKKFRIVLYHLWCEGSWCNKSNIDSLSWLPIKQCVELSLLKLVQKVIYSKSQNPEYLDMTFSRKFDRKLRNSDGLQLERNEYNDAFRDFSVTKFSRFLNQFVKNIVKILSQKRFKSIWNYFDLFWCYRLNKRIR